MFGNLCIMTRSENSRRSNLEPGAKIEQYDSNEQSLKFQLMKTAAQVDEELDRRHGSSPWRAHARPSRSAGRRGEPIRLGESPIMSRMIPPSIADDAPPGERAAFEALRDAPGTDDWIVFHSLGIGRHVSQLEGEADFVVLAPGHGILVIEVKSHLRVQADDSGRWKLGNDEWTTRSPFQQASGEFHSIMEFLRQRSLEPVAYPAGYAVWFTAIARQNIPPAIGWHEWAVMDAADLGNAASAVRRVLGAIDRTRPRRRSDIGTWTASRRRSGWSGSARSSPLCSMRRSSLPSASGVAKGSSRSTPRTSSRCSTWSPGHGR